MTQNRLTRQLNILGIYQIAGGLMGLCITFFLLYKLAISAALFLALIGIIIVLYSFSIYSGWALLKKGDSALNLSYINQLLQIVFFSFSGLTIKYSSGVFFNIGVDLSDSFLFKIDFGLSTWALEINSDDKIYFAINIVAILILFYIGNLKKEAARINDQLFAETN